MDAFVQYAKGKEFLERMSGRTGIERHALHVFPPGVASMGGELHVSGS
jgi:hypothetical protein